MDMELIPVTEDNRREALLLHIAPSQAGMVETVEECLKEADRLPQWRPVVIAREGAHVGFAMYGLWESEGTSGRAWLDRFFIDERYQGRGLSTPALLLLIERIEREYGVKEVYLSVYGDNRVAIHLYEKEGFVFNGERDVNGEKVMVRA